MVRAELLASRGSHRRRFARRLARCRLPARRHGSDQADNALRTGQPIHSMLSHVTDFDLNRGLTLEAELDRKPSPTCTIIA